MGYTTSKVENADFKYILFFISNWFLSKLALGWQVAKQLSGPIPILLSNNKNYRLSN